MRIVWLTALLFLAFPAWAGTLTEDLAAREAWQKTSTLVKTLVRVDIENKGRQTESTLLRIERTPHGRLRMLSHQDLTAKPTLTYVIQEGVNMAVPGWVRQQGTSMIVEEEIVHQPPGVVDVGHLRLHEPLEPDMLLAWIQGLPGPSHMINAQPAELVAADDTLSGLRQDGWSVSYGQWAKLGSNPLATPQQLTIANATSRVSIQVIELDMFQAIPADYQEFSILE